MSGARMNELYTRKRIALGFDDGIDPEGLGQSEENDRVWSELADRVETPQAINRIQDLRTLAESLRNARCIKILKTTLAAV